MKARYALTGIVLACTLSVSIAQSPLTAGELAKRSIELGEPTAAQLTGSAVVYLHKSFRTSAPVFGEASVLQKIDDNCARVRIRITIPDVKDEFSNPVNPTEKRVGPFETIVDANFCDSYRDDSQK